jgi:hypothetical protein
MNEYTLKLCWRTYGRDDDNNYGVQQNEGTFVCTVVDGRLQLPAVAQRIIGKRAGSLGVTSMEWVGERPTAYKCGALTEEEAALLSEKANAEADLAMRLLDETEPERQPSLGELVAPAEGPVKIIGEADYENDVPLLCPELDSNQG